MKESSLSKLEDVLKEYGVRLPAYIKPQIHFKEYAANSVICSAGDVVYQVQWLLEGELVISNIFSDGSEYSFASEKGFTVLGDIEFFSGHHIYATSVISKTKVIFVQFDFALFRRWLEEDSILYDLVVRQMAVKCYKGTSKQGNIKYVDSRERIINMLLALAQFPKDGVCYVECSHYELAKMTGMSERTVARLLKKLQDEGYLKLEYRRIVMKPDIMNLD